MSGGHVTRSRCSKHDVPMIATVTDSVYCAVCEHAEADRLRAELDIVRQKLTQSYQECETHSRRLPQAETLLQRAKLAVLEADSDFSAYAAGRHLDKESASRVSWMCRQLYSDIVKWLLDHNGDATELK